LRKLKAAGRIARAILTPETSALHEGDGLGQVGIKAFTYVDTFKTLLASRATADMGVGDKFDLTEDLPAVVKLKRVDCGVNRAT